MAVPLINLGLWGRGLTPEKHLWPVVVPGPRQKMELSHKAGTGGPEGTQKVMESTQKTASCCEAQGNQAP